MKRSILQHVDLHGFDLEESDLEMLSDRSVVVTKWNWDYAKAHQFQRAILGLVQSTPALRVLICCSHPEVLTNGRGLQKPRKGESLSLVDFNPRDHQELPFPFFQIERGGGLTFHHPGQFIFYPIVKLNPKALSLSKMIDDVFKFSAAVLDDWGLRGAHHEHQLLGLWKDGKKLASMGIAIEKLTTFHGVALNLKGNEKIKQGLATLNPCGLTSDVYTAVDQYVCLPENALEKFKTDFLKRIRHEWE